MSKTKLNKLVLVIFAALIGGILLNTPAFADKDTVYTKITSSQLIKLLESSGGKGTEKPNNLVIWEFDSSGISAIKISEDQTNIVFLFFDSKIKANPDKLNKWNQEKAFSKAYIDNDGDAFLELDFDFTDGVSEANFLNFLKICQASFWAFIKDME
jgi:hypothetical protein